MIIITTTPQQKADIAAYWASVREGLHVPAQHEFRQFTQHDVDAAVFKSMEEIKKAAFMARAIEVQAEAEMERMEGGSA